jgi:hypothetical protein
VRQFFMSLLTLDQPAVERRIRGRDFLMQRVKELDAEGVARMHAVARVRH